MLYHGLILKKGKAGKYANIGLRILDLNEKFYFVSSKFFIGKKNNFYCFFIYYLVVVTLSIRQSDSFRYN